MLKRIIISLKIWLPFLIVALYILGTIHSHYKHAEDSHNPFLMIYRGVEFFWHNNIDEADSVEQLKSDTQSLFDLLINAITHERNSNEQEKELDEFRNKIKVYPKDKILFLKRAGAFYVAYNSSLDSDLMMRVIGDTMFYTPNFLSARTKTLMDSITVYQKINQAQSLIKAINTTWGNKDSIIKMKANAKNTILINNNLERKEMKEIYDAIFNGV